jgi:cytochrome P450
MPSVGLQQGLVGPKPIRGLEACRRYIEFFHDPIACMREAYRREGLLSAVGKVLPFTQGERLYALAIGPEFNRQTLGDTALFRPSGPPRRWGSHDYCALHRLSNGLTRMTGTKHQQQRRLVMPPFQRKAVDSYCRTIASATDQLLEDWAAKESVDIWPEIGSLALRILSRTLFDMENTKTAYALGRMFQDWFTLIYSPGVWIVPFDVPGSPRRRLLKFSERLEREILRVIEEKRTASAEGQDVLSRLIRVRDEDNAQMTATDLVGQTTILFVASYKNVSSALTWTLFLMAQHPGDMADLLDELDGTLHGEPPTSEQLDELPLLDAVVKESLRILPPVPMTFRAVTGPVELGGLQLKEGDRVVLGHYMTHHLPKLYPDPEEFRPRRWFEIDPDQYEYVPFSAGPRSCIGDNYTTMVLKVSLAMILQRVRLTMIPGSRIDRYVDFSLSPKYGLPMAIHRQDRKFRSSPVRGNIHEMVKLPS